MNIKTIDAMKLIIETIYQDHYLKTYFGMRFKDLHIPQPIARSIEDLAQFRNGIVDERNAAGKNKDGTYKLTQVTRTISLQ